MHHEANGSTHVTEGWCALPCTGTRATVLVSGDRTEGRLAIVEAIEHGGATHPVHVHSREDELVYVLEGRVRFYLDGAWIERGSGETLLLPRGSEHSHAVVSAARLLVVLTPAGLEGYYRELGQPAAGPCVYQDAERLVVVAARYGIDITGPAPPIPVALT
jgi:quercetin dioxygenase-like cupin family protein